MNARDLKIVDELKASRARIDTLDRDLKAEHKRMRRLFVRGRNAAIPTGVLADAGGVEQVTVRKWSRPPSTEGE